MHRYLALAFLAACTATPETDTGQLTRFEDRMFAECQDGSGFTCGVQVTVTDGQISAVGVRNDGETNGATTTGLLTADAQLALDDMIARIPMSTPSTVHDQGCGLAPIRATNLDVMFDVNGLRHFDIEFASEGAMAELHTLVLDLVTEIRLCNGSHLTFDACQPNSL